MCLGAKVQIAILLMIKMLESSLPLIGLVGTSGDMHVMYTWLEGLSTFKYFNDSLILFHEPRALNDSPFGNHMLFSWFLFKR